MKRIFIAVKVDAGQNLKSMISTFRNSLTGENIRWVEPENLHLTLAFLGDTEEEKIKIVSSLLQECCTGFSEFGFTLKGVGIFKNIREPRVIWVGIQLSDKLLRLNEIIRSGFKNCGFNIEERQFKPHLTLGRVKFLKTKTNLNTILKKYYEVELQNVPVKEVILYESILRPAGPRYNPIHIVKLR
jgi:RNA 2',3'-cyclic 3'-phosphodiesterase